MNTGGYVWANSTCVCPSACLCKCIHNDSETLQPVKDTSPCAFHSKVTAYNAEENPRNSALPFSTVSALGDSLLQMNKVSNLSALLGQLLSPVLWLACHIFLIVSIVFFCFFGLCDSVGIQWTSWRVVCITLSHLEDLLLYSLLGKQAKSPQIGGFYDITTILLGLCWAKFNRRDLKADEICLWEDMLRCNNTLVLMYCCSKCCCGLYLPQLKKVRQSSCGTGVMLSFTMSLALS